MDEWICFKLGMAKADPKSYHPAKLHPFIFKNEGDISIFVQMFPLPVFSCHVVTLPSAPKILAP